ncbi:MAG: hypothetical protein Q7O66_07315 [Dehalococcoidia bacterium]|nr:hypothetical protein [Dehalococcoidia bacterium]
MSERGSFVTEYMGCDECFRRMRVVLEKNGKFLKGVVIPPWEGYPGAFLPILVGKIGGGYPGEEWYYIMCELFTKENAPCHPVRIAVLTEAPEEQCILEVQTNGIVKTIVSTRRKVRAKRKEATV